jgi:hypothetical protein
MLILRSVGIAAAALLALTSVVTAQEKKIRRSQLPPAVERTVAAQSKGATVRGFSEEREKGQTYYEVQLTVNGLGKDVLIDTGGTVVTVEQQVPFDSLPDAVKAALREKAGTSRIVLVESVKERDRPLVYEAHLMRAGRRSEIKVGPDGKSPEE